MDIEAYEERAAIMEFDGGMSRFEAETAAAKAQGLNRWEAVNEIRKRDTKRTRDHGQAAAREPADNVSGVQQHATQENGPLPIGHVSTGWGAMALLALLEFGGRIL